MSCSNDTSEDLGGVTELEWKSCQVGWGNLGEIEIVERENEEEGILMKENER